MRNEGKSVVTFTDEQVKQILKRIEKELSLKGIKKYDFYQGARISSALFSNWNTGKAKPTMVTLAKVADYLGVTLDYLVSGENKNAAQEDGESIRIRELLRERPEMRILFDAGENAPTSAILEAAALIMRYKEGKEEK